MKLLDFFKHYKGLPHQDKAIEQLSSLIHPEVLTTAQPWYKTWSTPPSAPATTTASYAPAVQLIKEYEGCVLKAYPDPGTGGDPWTIGYGNTFYPDGARVKPGDVITKDKATELLYGEVNRIAKILESKIPAWKELNNNQRSALISFSYNVGPYWYNSDGFGTISRTIASRLWKNVPDVFKLYVNPGTSVTVGLTRRRIAEGNLWFKPV
jgi:GH24 family phage-related lysozyme (muramidase)